MNRYPFIKVIIINCLLEQDGLTGYDIIKYCRGNGIPASSGTVYPHLKAMEDAGIIAFREEGRRKVYYLTEAGRAEMESSALGQRAGIPEKHIFQKHLARRDAGLDEKGRSQGTCGQCRRNQALPVGLHGQAIVTERSGGLPGRERDMKFLQGLSKAVMKLRYAIVAFWMVAAVLIVWKAPVLSKVASSDETSFLPANSETMEASALYKQLFPTTGNRSSFILVLTDAGGMIGRRPPIRQGDRGFPERR